MYHTSSSWLKRSQFNARPRGRVFTSLCAAFLSVGVALASAMPISGTSIDALYSKSTSVFSGTVIDTAQRGAAVVDVGGHSLTGRQVDLDVRVDEVLKGTADSSVRVHVGIPDGPDGAGIAMTVPEEGAYEVFFVSGHDGAIAPTNLYQLGYPARSAPRSSLSGIERVGELVGAVLDDQRSTSQDKTLAVLALAGATTASSISGLQRALVDQDRDIRCRAVAMLVGKRGVNIANTASTLLSRPDAESVACIGWLRSAVAWDLKESAGAADFSVLAHEPEVETRRAAVTGLARLQSPTAVLPLAQFLNDSDPQVQYWVAKGLRDGTGAGRTVALDASTAERSDVIESWRSWARARGMIK